MAKGKPVVSDPESNTLSVADLLTRSSITNTQIEWEELRSMVSTCQDFCDCQGENEIN